MPQFGVFRPGLVDDWQVGVGIFPDRENILVSSVSFGRVAGVGENPSQLQARHRAYGVGHNDARVIQELLEFHRGFGFPLRFHISQPSHVGWMEPSKLAEERDPSHGKFVRVGTLQRFERLGVTAIGECEEGAQRGQVTELDRGILGEAFFQIAGERLRCGGIA